MHFPRLSYWLVCLAIVLALLDAALGRREHADAPPPPPPLPAAEGQVLAQAAPIDPALLIKVTPLAGHPAGVAFSVADRGVWLTARSVVAGCARAAILTGGGQGVVAAIAPGATSDVAVLTTASGAPALGLAGGGPPHAALVFAPGFVAGRPAEAATRVEGEEALRRPGRDGRGATTVLVLAEIGRTEGLTGSLAGLAGAPALDVAGRVVGVILGDAPRRGRLYAAPPAAIAAALRAANARPAAQAGGAALSTDDYGVTADDLRRSLRVAQVVCTRA